MFKIIACDLDETLLSDNTHICIRNRIAIQKARQLGVKFVPATGRGFKAITPTLKELGLDQQPKEYVISFNGGCITENKNNRILNFQGLSFKKASELYRRGLKYNVCIHVYTKDLLYMYHANQDEINYTAPRHPYRLINEQNIDFLKDQDIAKLLYGNTNQKYLRKIAKDLSKITTNLSVSYSSNRYLEFNPSGIDKGFGLLWLARKLGVKPEETMAIGDNFNDLPMIQAAGLGVGMANTNPDMKSQCDLITQADNNQGGVAEAIERFVLKK